ncbi:DUF6270 domain-containing protein [Rheinheimera soli]|uniref:Heparinase II/III-like C-terminal domain-containing protein n=1 Tax=Rheinheimera soli TaxID=443616 RepID=A0ABU1VUA5_9GAMM|nr:DUF6270 domain-containing protein [Rheinheimera soli]MDR7119300.1 hypothetical protein [Rheinheimera soli]
MDSPIKVFIMGSCVSRDPFEIAHKRDFDIVAYYARSSFASLGAEPFVDEKLLSGIKSDWQRKMVRADMEKRVFSQLITLNFDVLLIDLIDERFSLSVFENSIHTISTEYKKALYRPNRYNFVKAGTEEKLRLWKEGAIKLSHYLISNGLDNKVIINRVYWSLKCDNTNNLLDRYSVESVKQANDQLNWMYDELIQLLPKARFINYRDDELEIDENHKWGIEPFHYTTRTFVRQLSSIYALSLQNIKFTIRHGLGNAELSFPIMWTINPFNSRPWLHHFMSLRWLNVNESPLFIANVLLSFYRFHCVKKAKNPYYNSMQGDHTASIRLGVFCEIMKKHINHDVKDVINVTNRLILEEIKNLQNNSMYRSGHNHGLMVDLSLLKVLKEFKNYGKNIDLNFVLHRSGETIDAMWHSSGLTKEHSVSYQEYNIPLAMDYFHFLADLGVKPLSMISLERIIEESKRFLGYSFKKDGEYFPLGNSFRLPNKDILNRVYNPSNESTENISELLYPYSCEEGVYSNSHFFIYRKTINGRLIHLAATCCWDSHNHKQNDELSFCFEIDGVSLFDDPGYTEFMQWDQLELLKSEYVHSTITVTGHSWCPKKDTNQASKLAGEVTTNGFIVKMQMSRIDGLLIERTIELEGCTLSVKDSITTHSDIVSSTCKKLNANFVLGPSIEVSESDFSMNNKVLSLSVRGRAFAQFHVRTKSQMKIEHNRVPYVMANRKLVKDTHGVTFQTEFFESSQTDYQITWSNNA